VGAEFHAEGRTDERTDMTKLIFDIYNFLRTRQEIPRSAHAVFMCFVWLSEQTAIISLYSINWLVFI